MEKLKKKLNIIVTVVLVLAVIFCVSTIVQVIQGEQPQLFGYHFYNVVSGSMEPEIPVDANVIVKEVDTDTLQVGDVITFSSRDPQIYGSANTHRIIEITQDEDGNTCYVTKGDANPVPDDLLVYPEEVYGVVVYHTTAIYWVSTFFDFVRTGTGFVTVIVFPLLFVAYLFTKDFVRAVNKMMKENLEEELKAEMKDREDADHEAGREEKTE